MKYTITVKGETLFDELHFKRWEVFAKWAEKEEAIYIFECAFMQNQIVELFLCSAKPYEQIKNHMNKLVSTVKNLNPLLIYLSQPDVAKTIAHVGAERHSDAFDWLTQFISYSENTPYAKAHNLQGLAGAIAMQEQRKQIELALLQELPLQSFVQENVGFNWEQAWQEIEEYLLLQVIC